MCLCLATSGIELDLFDIILKNLKLSQGLTFITEQSSLGNNFKVNTFQVIQYFEREAHNM